MGFFGMWKKKSDLPTGSTMGSNGMELPTIDGKRLDGSLDLNMPLPQMTDIPGHDFGSMEMPTDMDMHPNDLHNDVSSNVGQNSANSNVNPAYMPQLDNSEPENPDDVINQESMEIDSEISDITNPNSSVNMAMNNPTSNNSMSDNSGLNSQLNNDQSNGQSSLASSSYGSDSNNDFEDVNRLFIGDDWKEPNWADYDPYSEEKIDEPASTDFGGSLPSFNANEQQTSTNFNNNNFMQSSSNTAAFINQQSDEESNEPLADPMMEESQDERIEEVAPPRAPVIDRPKSSSKPVELYIKGRAYAKVFMELDTMNAQLSKIDSRLNGYEDIVKREEPLISNARDQMEYLYKKIMIVDKKIFANQENQG